VAGGWRILHNEELYNFDTSSNIIKVIKSKTVRWAGHVASMGKMKIHTTFWSENMKRQLGRPRRRWENNIRMGLRESAAIAQSV
jgi:hypothetical protein